jgi:hypothetical protein
VADLIRASEEDDPHLSRAFWPVEGVDALTALTKYYFLKEMIRLYEHSATDYTCAIPINREFTRGLLKVFQWQKKEREEQEKADRIFAAKALKKRTSKKKDAKTDLVSDDLGSKDGRDTSSNGGNSDPEDAILICSEEESEEQRTRIRRGNKSSRAVHFSGLDDEAKGRKELDTSQHPRSKRKREHNSGSSASDASSRPVRKAVQRKPNAIFETRAEEEEPMLEDAGVSDEEGLSDTEMELNDEVDLDAAPEKIPVSLQC